MSISQILQVVSSGVDKRPSNNPGFSQEYYLESMMSVAACTNSPMKSLQKANPADQYNTPENSVSTAAKFVSSVMSVCLYVCR